MSDYYKILGVSPKASQDEIKRAFRRKVKFTHPDVNPSPDASDAFVKLNEAYDTLADPRRRAMYNLSLHTSSVDQQAQGRKWNNEEYAQAYAKFSRTQRAYQRSRPPKKGFERGEENVRYYMQAVLYVFGFVLAAFFLFFPFAIVYYADWKGVFLTVLFAPLALNLSRESAKGITEWYEGLP